MGASELSEEHRLLIDEVWLLLREKGRWPTFAELDRRLYNSYDIQADSILPHLPPGLVHDAGSANLLNEDTRIALTVAGVEATGRGRRELSHFCEVLRYAVDLEREYEPPANHPDSRPRLTVADVATRLGIAGNDDLLARLGALLATESWGWKSASTSGAEWWFEIDRSVRKFRGVTGSAMYTEVKGASNPADPSAVAIAVAEKSAGAGQWRIMIAAASFVVGATAVVMFLTGQGLDRAEKWMSIVGVTVGLLLSVGGLVLGWMNRTNARFVMESPRQGQSRIRRQNH